MAKLEDLINDKSGETSGEYTPSTVPCSFTTGAAGCGKTYLQRKLIEEDPTYGVLCATTGISAINLGTTTLNSVLRYFDTDSLRDRFNRGYLTTSLHRIGKKVRTLVIDECSMMDGRQLDYIHQALVQVNEFKDMEERPMGIVLTGDLCQLSPIKAPWIFEADCWPNFEHNTTRLTKSWRQTDLQFLSALNAARAGHGKECVDILKSLKVKFLPQQDGRFTGTTIMAKNDQVDNFNYSALMDVKGDAFGLKKLTWGEQSGEWKNIPEVLKLKEGAYVMILSNDTQAGGFSYANGDCGTIQSKDMDGTIWVKLARNEQVVGIKPIIRYKTMTGTDAEKLGMDAFFEGSEALEGLNPYGTETKPRTLHIFCENSCGWNENGIKHGPWGQSTYNCPSGSWNVGAVKFYPLRLAYATSVHKSQGLTLDRCQIDCRDIFFGSPNMAYVSLSRCRTSEGLVIVGSPEKLAERIKLDPKVRRWL